MSMRMIMLMIMTTTMMTTMIMIMMTMIIIIMIITFGWLLLLSKCEIIMAQDLASVFPWKNVRRHATM
eukprot:627352-Karenia_brevis.AAC.1